MSIYAPTTEGFQSLLRISRSSIADPPWFAAPVDAHEDAESVTVVFHVPVKSHGRVRVQASDQSVTAGSSTGNSSSISHRSFWSSMESSLAAPRVDREDSGSR